MEGLSINIIPEWHSRQTDASKCSICEQIIVTDMWELFLFVNGDPVASDLKLCQSCYELLPKDEQ